MKFTIEKNLKIVNELITYFYKLGNSNVHIDLTTEDNKSYFCISGEIKSISTTEIDSLIKILNVPRQHEVEQYYWHLGGESEFDCELTLVGMMVDDATVDYKDGILTVKLLRKDSLAK